MDKVESDNAEDMLVLQQVAEHPIVNPEGHLADVLGRLVSSGFVDRTDKSRNGYSALLIPTYSISKAGKVELRRRYDLAEKEAAENIKQEAQEAKSERLRVEDARAEKRRFWLGLFLGWVLGCFTPVDVWRWVAQGWSALVAWLQSIH